MFCVLTCTDHDSENPPTRTSIVNLRYHLIAAVVDYMLGEASAHHRLQPPVTYWPWVIYVFSICSLGNSGCSISNVVYDFIAGSDRRHRWFPPSRLHPKSIISNWQSCGEMACCVQGACGSRLTWPGGKSYIAKGQIILHCR